MAFHTSAARDMHNVVGDGDGGQTGRFSLVRGRLHTRQAQDAPSAGPGTTIPVEEIPIVVLAPIDDMPLIAVQDHARVADRLDVFDLASDPLRGERRDARRLDEMVAA